MPVFIKTDAIKKLIYSPLTSMSAADSANWLDLLPKASQQTVKPDDHSEVVPLLPIPNRTVKRLSADDSADSRVKVGHRQALTARNAQLTGSTGRFLSKV